jgi:hypothetical protein
MNQRLRCRTAGARVRLMEGGCADPAIGVQDSLIILAIGDTNKWERRDVTLLRRIPLCRLPPVKTSSVSNGSLAKTKNLHPATGPPL